MVIAILFVIAGVVFAARGRGGELSVERSDYVPLDLGPVSATDVALFRPSTGLWGYSMQATDEALDRIAEAVRERDVRIVALEQLVTDLGRDHAPMTPLASPYAGARHRRMPMQDTAETASPPWREPEQQQWQDPEQQQWREPEQQPWREPETQPWREPETQTWQEPAQQPWQEPEQQPWQEPEQQPWQEPEQQQWQEPEQQQWQEPEPPWQTPEPPRPAGDTPAPPPERSHD
jgi:hypothetical protein